MPSPWLCTPRMPELVVEEHGVALSSRRLLFLRAGDLRLEGVADVDAERRVPVASTLTPSLTLGTPDPSARPALAAVDDREQAEHDDDDHGDGENRAALEANLLAFAARGEPGNFLADDDGATRVRGYRLPESKQGHASALVQLDDQVRVGPARRRLATPPARPTPPGRRHRLARPRVVGHASQRALQRREVVGRHADSRRPTRQGSAEPRCRDRSPRAPGGRRRGSSTSSTAR